MLKSTYLLAISLLLTLAYGATIPIVERDPQPSQEYPRRSNSLDTPASPPASNRPDAEMMRWSPVRRDADEASVQRGRRREKRSARKDDILDVVADLDPLLEAVAVVDVGDAGRHHK